MTTKTEQPVECTNHCGHDLCYTVGGTCISPIPNDNRPGYHDCGHRCVPAAAQGEGEDAEQRAREIAKALASAIRKEGFQGDVYQAAESLMDEFDGSGHDIALDEFCGVYSRIIAAALSTPPPSPQGEKLRLCMRCGFCQPQDSESELCYSCTNPPSPDLERELAEIEARRNAITPGPFAADVMPYRATVNSPAGIIAEVIEGDLGKDAQRANAKFIAHAPADIRRLLELVRGVKEGK